MPWDAPTNFVVIGIRGPLLDSQGGGGAGVFVAGKLFISTGLVGALKISHFVACLYGTVLEVMVMVAPLWRNDYTTAPIWTGEQTILFTKTPTCQILKPPLVDTRGVLMAR